MQWLLQVCGRRNLPLLATDFTNSAPTVYFTHGLILDLAMHTMEITDLKRLPHSEIVGTGSDLSSSFD
jgi:hypothetical protein